MTAQYIVGIDLGTTNSVLAYTALDAAGPEIELVPIPQMVAADSVESRTTLPSFLYLAGEHEIGDGAYALPWPNSQAYAVGEFARRQGAEVPDRTVTAAKSWLCHSRVDRHAPILPWGAAESIPKVSPVIASQRYLEHLMAAWEAAMPDAPIAEQVVVLTVPASFDASARELTREAAIAAGIPRDLVLLEEPQAAVYSWLATMGDRWRRVLDVGNTLLVADVGGGTTDLTLIGVRDEAGELVLQRVAVGNHLLVGGDNMDLALAHHASERFAEQGIRLDPWQSVALWHACRSAKETLFCDADQPTHPITILGRGSRLIGGTVSIDLARDTVIELVTEGFFPHCRIDDRPAKQRISGFREIGLPFEKDTAITRHLASFLQSHGLGDGHPARPTHVLFNGGVFTPVVLQHRLMEVLSDWFGAEKAPRILAGIHHLDHAAARGAAYYGWAKQFHGVRIRGGTARSYYIGIETAGLAIPGAVRPLRALCVVPIGMEEGTETDVPSHEIGLVVGEPAHFRFFSSSVRKEDQPGTLLTSWTEDELQETDSMEAVLPADALADESYIPVKFHSKITELGTFELWCQGLSTNKQWKLEFSVREDAGGE